MRPGPGDDRRLAAGGYSVVVYYLYDQGAAESTVGTVLAGHGTALAVCADVADGLDVHRLFAETIVAFGRVDVVVHGRSPWRRRNRVQAPTGTTRGRAALRPGDQPGHPTGVTKRWQRDRRVSEPRPGGAAGALRGASRRSLPGVGCRLKWDSAEEAIMTGEVRRRPPADFGTSIFGRSVVQPR
jgi:NAD(P)-dependent dehydrogenase (short-subunit alcohol dehydrogenase family)